MRPLALAAILFLAGCSGAPILPTDAVKTPDEAIRLAKERCGVSIYTHWSARLVGEYWVVRSEGSPANYGELRILKSDGSGKQCTFIMTAT
jgi:hypothetical protein